METDLGEIIKSSEEGIDEKIIKYFMFQIIKGVKFIHDSGIIHRDLVSDIL